MTYTSEFPFFRKQNFWFRKWIHSPYFTCFWFKHWNLLISSSIKSRRKIFSLPDEMFDRGNKSIQSFFVQISWIILTQNFHVLLNMTMQHELPFLIMDKQAILVHRDYFVHQNYHRLWSKPKPTYIKHQFIRDRITKCNFSCLVSMTVLTKSILMGWKREI